MGAAEADGVVVEMDSMQKRSKTTDQETPPQPQQQPLLSKKEAIPKVTKRVLRGPLAPINNFFSGVEE